MDEYPRTGFSKYVSLHAREVENKTRGCVVAEALEPLLGQAVNEMVAIMMEDIETCRFCQNTRRTGLEWFYYRRVFCRDEAVNCFLFKELELRNEKTLGWKVVGEKVIQ